VSETRTFSRRTAIRETGAVARALSGGTRPRLRDEPFEGLAPAVVEGRFEAFARLREAPRGSVGPDQPTPATWRWRCQIGRRRWSAGCSRISARRGRGRSTPTGAGSSCGC